MSSMQSQKFEKIAHTLAVLVIDDNQYARKIVRNILSGFGIKTIHEAVDGVAGLEVVRATSPDIIILDWAMPLLNGTEFMRCIRSLGESPAPDVPVILLTGHSSRSLVIEMARLGVNEFLVKPVSGKALFDRMMTIMTNPRPMVKIGDYYGPEPRTKFPLTKAPPPPPGVNQLPPPSVVDRDDAPVAAADGENKPAADQAVLDEWRPLRKAVAARSR